MPKRFQFLALLLGLALILALPGALFADDEPMDEPKDPPTEEPTDPPADEPEHDPSEPPPVIENVPDEPETDPDPEVPVKPPARMAEQKTFPRAGTPAGMIWVPPGTALIGTKYERLSKLTRPRSKDVQRDFAFEAPQHTVGMSAYYFDQFEVTNAQYLLFMEQTAATTYDTDEATLASLEEVAGFLIGLPRDRWSYDDIAWRQLYRANKDMLQEKMADRVVMAGGKVDQEKTEAAFQHAPLVRGMVLQFYSRKLPETWTSTRPEDGMLDLPVMSVSYDDTEAFAEWAGKHVPTEQEWEYAARGPEGYLWPWGDEWFEDDSRANWGGKNINESFNPVPLGVETVPEGRSWCGAYHMLGNAGEWTSSWFDRYPGNDREHRFMGQYVKVIRGSTYVDIDPLVLRLAARNFIGAGMKAPPRPGNRFEYIGFRCAWYRQPGRDQLGPIMRRVARGRRVTDKNVVLERYAGAAAVKFAAEGSTPENHVFVEGQAHSIVVIPLAYAIRPDAKLPKLKNRKKLKAWSVETDDPLPLAVLHTDIELDKVYVRAPRQKDDDKKKKKNGKHKKEAPPTVRGVCPPGTYVIGFWHERLCLCHPSLEFVCFLQKGTARTGELDLKKVKPEDFPAAVIEAEPDADLLFVGFATPLGGASHDEKVTLVIQTLELNPKEGALSEAGTWRSYSRPSAD